MHKYELIISGKNFANLKNQYFRTCRTLQKPFIIIKKKWEYASVLFDYINLPSKYDQYIKWSKFYEFCISLFEQYKNFKSRLNIGLYQFENLSIENAQILANKLFDFINESIMKQHG